MKRLYFFIMFFSLSVSLHKSAFAHSPGQPPFFKVNGKYADFYTVMNATGTTDQLPQDLAPEPYLLNSAITFTIDTNKLLIPLPVVNDTAFMWDFGDSAKGSGLTQVHSYTRAGTYTVTILASYKGSDPQLFQSMMLHIIPDSTYVLPKAIIYVDGKKIDDPLIDSISFAPNQRLTFDATHSIGQSLTYKWDFGADDENSSTSATPHISTDPRTTFQYNPKRLLAYPRLRVIDGNGFVSDTAVQLLSEKYSIDQNSTPVTISKKSSFPIQTVFIVVNLTLLIVAGMYILMRRVSRKKRIKEVKKK